MNKIITFITKTFLYKSAFYVCQTLGKNVLMFFSAIGRFSLFFGKMIESILNRQFFFKNLLESIYINGFCSIPVVGLTGIFTGAVLTVQLFNSLKMFGIDNTIPYIVLVALMKELAPVLGGLMVVSRVGSSMSAEIGSMATNNQLDVLTSMSVNKFRFLYLPRIISMAIFQPILTTIAIITGVIGSFFVATKLYGFTDLYYLKLLYEGFEWSDYYMGVIKGAVFGIIISLIACYKGNDTEEGALGVKKTTITTVVLCCVYLLLFNFIITWLIG